MTRTFNKSVLALILMLVVANIFFFVFSISLSDELNHYEQKIVDLRRENLNLEKKVAGLSSLSFAEILADNWGFEVKSEPVYLDKLGFAFNR